MKNPNGENTLNPSYSHDEWGIQSNNLEKNIKTPKVWNEPYLKKLHTFGRNILPMSGYKIKFENM